MTATPDFLKRAFPAIVARTDFAPRTLDETCYIVRKAVSRFFPDAAIVLVSGSSVGDRGEWTIYSDIDIIIVEERNLLYERRCFEYAQCLIDTHIFGQSTIRHYLASARSRGVRSLADAIGKSVVLIDRAGQARDLQAFMADLAGANPPTPPPEIIDSARIGITELLVDLCAATDPRERLACGMALYQPLTALMSLQHGGWLDYGKQLPRKLGADGNALFAALLGAYRSLHDNDIVPLVNLSEDMLAAWGGPLWVGYRSSVPFNAPARSPRSASPQTAPPGPPP